MKESNPACDIKVNAHIHTPYSFSAFARLEDALDQAVQEKVQVVGINDFFSVSGYREWSEGALARKLFPLFNIEFMTLDLKAQAEGQRINDPSNPGRIYLSGKGLRYPTLLGEREAAQLEQTRQAMNRQVKMNCDKLNEVLKARQIDLSLDFSIIESLLTKGIVRERHLAKALRMQIYDLMNNEPAAIAACFKQLFDGSELAAAVTDTAAVENEMRTKLLKAGGSAFVPEDPAAFMSTEDAQQLILAAGGIPTYPFLADYGKGVFTDFEGDLQQAAEQLKEKKIFSVEFIPTRNELEVLEAYAGYLYDQGFVVTFGSEHNTPASEPMELFAKGGRPLSDRLKQINYDGVCVIAAHQQLFREGEPGYVDATGQAALARRAEFEQLGDQLIQAVIK